MSEKTELLDWNKQISVLQDWRASGSTIVFTNGCFDIVHAGHIGYLNEAKSLGDRLVIGLNSDESVRRLKGQSRPIHSFTDRALVLSNLAMVDMVIGFEEDTPLSLIKQILPDYLVKGGDYSIDQIVGAQEVISNGGKVLSLAYIPGYSSSQIIQKLKNED